MSQPSTQAPLLPALSADESRPVLAAFDRAEKNPQSAGRPEAIYEGVAEDERHDGGRVYDVTARTPDGRSLRVLIEFGATPEARRPVVFTAPFISGRAFAQRVLHFGRTLPMDLTASTPNVPALEPEEMEGGTLQNARVKVDVYETRPDGSEVEGIELVARLASDGAELSTIRLMLSRDMAVKLGREIIAACDRIRIEDVTINLDTKENHERIDAFRAQMAETAGPLLGPAPRVAPAAT